MTHRPQPGTRLLTLRLSTAQFNWPVPVSWTPERKQTLRPISCLLITVSFLCGLKNTKRPGFVAVQEEVSLLWDSTWRECGRDRSRRQVTETWPGLLSNKAPPLSHDTHARKHSGRPWRKLHVHVRGTRRSDSQRGIFRSEWGHLRQQLLREESFWEYSNARVERTTPRKHDSCWFWKVIGPN